MDILTTLPAPWPLQPGEKPTPAAEAAAALLELASDAQADAAPMLAQLSAADDVTPAAIALGMKLQAALSEATALAAELVGAAQ
jgi:hypothetical protein